MCGIYVSVYMRTYILEIWNIFISPWSRWTAVSNNMFYYTTKPNLMNKKKWRHFYERVYIQAPEFSSVWFFILHTHVVRQGCAVLITSHMGYSLPYPCVSHPCSPAVSPLLPASHSVCNSHSWPIGRRAIWFPCIQWHFSPDLARLSLWGTFSCVCHFGRAKGRSVPENDCMLGDRGQTVGCEKPWKENLRTFSCVHQSESRGNLVDLYP